MNAIGFNPSGPTLRWRESLVHGLLLLALLVATFPGVFLKGEVLSSSDALFHVLPWELYAPEDHEYPANLLMLDPIFAFRSDFMLVQNAMREGEWPLWNNLEMTGMPLLANCQSTVFYPPRFLLIWLDVDAAMTAFVVFKLWLCGATAFICTRLLGMAAAPARFFSVAWMLGSYNLLWGSWPLPDVSAWVPVVFMGCEFLLRGQYRRGFFATALGGAQILYAGHPETAFTFVNGIGFYFAVRLLLGRRWGRALWLPIVYMGLGWLAALALYAPQLLPFLEYLVNSYTYSQRDVDTLQVLLPAGAATAAWVPRFWGTLSEKTWWDISKWNSNIVGKQYLGMLIWFGLSALLVRIPAGLRSRDRGHQIAGFLIAALIGILLTYSFPTLNWVHDLPLFGSIVEAYHLCFALFALPLAATIGLERWFARKRSLRELACALPVIALAATIIVVVYRFNFNVMEMKGPLEGVDLVAYVRFQILIAAISALVALGFFAVSCLWYRPQVLWAVATLLFAVDHWVACRNMNPTMPNSEAYPQTALTDWMKAKERPVRFAVAEAAIPSGAVANYGIEEWLGYDGLYPEPIMWFMTELGPQVLENAEPVRSIQYILNEPDPELEPLFPLEEMLEEGDIELETTIDGLEVYRNVNAFPRASLVGGLRTIPERDELFEAMLDDEFRPAAGVLTMTELDHSLPETADTRPGTAEVVEYESTRVVVEVDAAADAVLVLTDAHYPGWRATINGEPADIFPAYYAFRGVLVSAGKHEVVFEYRPASLRYGLIISIAAMAVVNGIAIWILLRRRRQAS